MPKLFSLHFAADCFGSFIIKQVTEVNYYSMKTIELFCCLAALASLTMGVEIQCRYQMRAWGVIVGNLYSCAATITSVENPGIVTVIRGTHMAGKVNTDVTEIFVDNHRILSKIPSGIENFFPNLKAYHWYNGNISTIDSSIYKPFSKLLRIELGQNKIETVDGNLFQHTHKLREIYFGLNKLKYVGHGLLTGLTDLVVAEFLSNPCINIRANTTQQIQELNLQLPIRCPPAGTTTTRTTPTATRTTLKPTKRIGK